MGMEDGSGTMSIHQNVRDRTIYMLVQSNCPQYVDKRETAIRASSHPQPFSFLHKGITKSTNSVLLAGVGVAGVVLKLVGYLES